MTLCGVLNRCASFLCCQTRSNDLEAAKKSNTKKHANGRKLPRPPVQAIISRSLIADLPNVSKYHRWRQGWREPQQASKHLHYCSPNLKKEIVKYINMTKNEKNKN